MAANFFALKLHKEFLLASFRISSRFSKLDRHVLRIQQYLLFQRPLYKLENQHFLRRLILIIDLDIYFGVSFHQVNQIHKPIYFFAFEAKLFQV